MNRETVEWFRAVKYSNVEYIKEHINQMFDARDEHGNTGLMHAAFYGNTSVVQILAEKSGKLLNSARKTALMQCICSDYSLGRASAPDIVDILRHYEAGVSDERGCTALMMAAERGDVRSIAALVEYEHGQKDSRGRTALMYAASFGQSECVPALLVETAEVDNKGMTALMFAAYGNNIQIIRQLVRYEARRRNRNNETALVIAIRQGREEAVSELGPHEKDIHYGSISPYQLAVELRQTACAEILRPQNAPVPTSAPVSLSSTKRQINDLVETAKDPTYIPTMAQSVNYANYDQQLLDQKDLIRQLQTKIQTLQQKVDTAMLTMSRAPTASTNGNAFEFKGSQMDVQGLHQQVRDQGVIIDQLKTALHQSQLEVHSLNESQANLLKRLAEMEKIMANTQIQLALGVNGEQSKQSIDNIMNHLGVLGESISNIDSKNYEEHRGFAAKLGSIQTDMLRIAQTEASRTEEISSLRDKFTFLHEELIKLSVTTQDTNDRISGTVKELETKVLSLDTRLKVRGNSMLLSSAPESAYSSSSITRAIAHLHEELYNIKSSIENVVQSIMTMHSITMQNLDALSSSHSMFIANYPVHKRAHDEVKLLEDLQNKIVRIDHYMEDMMKEDKLEAIMAGFIELNSRVDQLVVDQARHNVESIPSRIGELERTIDAVLTVLNEVPEKGS